MLRIFFSWIVAMISLGVVGLNCSGTTTGDGDDASVDGGTDIDSDDENQGAECEKDEDCFFGACCSCTPVTSAPDCSDLGCASPDCSGLTAVCGPGGDCEAQPANCDPAEVTCKAMPPDCPGFMLPQVIDGCWAKECIPAENCSLDCSGGPCPWLCPADGDELVVVSVDGKTGVLQNQADEKQFDCELIFDQEDDQYDCAAQLTVGGSFSATGSSSGNLCNSGQEQQTIIATGNPQQCTFQCTVL